MCVGGLCGVVVVSLAQGLRSLSSGLTLAIFHLVFHLPPTSPTSPPSCDWYLTFAGVQIQGLSHETAMVQVVLQVPTPLAARKGLFSCEFLARLQELSCMAHSDCLVHRHPGSAKCVCDRLAAAREFVSFCTSVGY